MGGGSIRIHDPDVQTHVLRNILKIGCEPFAYLIRGLESGCPPHGGIAFGKYLIDAISKYIIITFYV